MTSPEAKVVFLPSGRRGNFRLGTTVLDAARSIGVDLDSVCGGRALCGRCQIGLAEGSFSKHGIESRAAHLSAVTDAERSFADRRGLADGRRLGCQAQIEGDLVVDVPAASQMHRQLVRKHAEHRDITLDPAVRLYFTEVGPADMHEPKGDAQRLRESMIRDWSLGALEIEHSVLVTLQQALRDGNRAVTAAVRDDDAIVAVWPGFRDRIYGAAIDIGSTTIALHLCDLTSGEVVHSEGMMNPQIRFGEDLMSRVSYLMMHPGSVDELVSSVRTAVNDLVAKCAQALNVDIDAVVEFVVAGNPVMHHLFFGIDPTELGGAPFALATDQSITVPARDLGIAANRGAEVYALPCVAGHVGADAAAVVLSEEPYLGEDISVVVDVGTNAEIVLGNSERLLACSSPTGPAFEGAQISCGQRAAPGAIERVRIDRKTLDVRVRVIGSDLWSDDPGFAEAVARTGVTGICGSGIIEAIAEMHLAGIISDDGVIDGALSDRSVRLIRDDRTWSFVLIDGDQRIVVTQNDVRQIQLAKAALYAGIKLLMDTADVRNVRHDPPCRRVRQPYRSAICDGDRADSGLPAESCGFGGQCGRDRRPHCVAQQGRAPRDRKSRAPDREDRNRRRTRVSAAFRRRDGVSAPLRRVSESLCID